MSWLAKKRPVFVWLKVCLRKHSFGGWLVIELICSLTEAINLLLLFPAAHRQSVIKALMNPCVINSSLLLKLFDID